MVLAPMHSVIGGVYRHEVDVDDGDRKEDMGNEVYGGEDDVTVDEGKIWRIILKYIDELMRVMMIGLKIRGK